MTQQNIQNDIESDRAVGEQENSESNQDATDRDHRVANPPIEAQNSSFKEYCAANPSASECKVYDL
ncbi:CP12 domain-containing protein [Allocoleopsis franciscana]|uniref:CP12 domain protein n=1 Tax=Allocoleopsis franciscana PCC 7113 TaxID=1173027 RepID=K9WDH6_9CYAN|nr:CP12 domain-containing protein [Allocoleopsis franciscana]AFZ18283.1 CP12 domain protein [Allocoleopsis franciscana PCC 7113]